MITFTCPSCESTLIAKDEKLIGKILACPKCGSMVLVQPPDDAPTPEYPGRPPSVPYKRFPDVLTHETASGIIGPTPKELIRSDLLLVEDFPEPSASERAVSEKEIKTRKILIGILIGLAMLLLAALGFLMLFHKPIPPAPPQPDPAVQPPPEVPEQPLPPLPPPQPPVEPEPIIPEEPDEAVTPSITPNQTETPPEAAEQESHEPEAPPPADDSLSAFERNMPGLLETSVPNIDIPAKLALPILDWTADQQSLVDFLRVMSSLTGIPITLDADALKPMGLSVKTPLAGHFSATTAETVLTDSLASVGLQWKIADRQITVVPKETMGSKETTDPNELTFNVADFTEQTGDLTSEGLAEMVQTLVCPEAVIQVLPSHQLSVVNELVVNDPALAMPLVKSGKRLQLDILRFLEQLRAIRQLPPQTEWMGETLAPEAFGWDQVMEPMTLHYYRPVPLVTVTEQLESASGLTILVDHQSLHQSLCSFAALRADVQCNGGTVNDALEMSLASVDTAALAYRMIDHETLEISTAETLRLPEKMTVEVHRYQLEEDETPEEIVRSLRSAIEPATWFTAGRPETRYGGNIVIDRPSGCLLVRQSQPVQRQIRLYLSESEPAESMATESM